MDILYKDTRFWDFYIITDTNEVHAHKCVLWVSDSRHLKQWVDVGAGTASYKKCDNDAVLTCVRFLYGEKFEIKTPEFLAECTKVATIMKSPSLCAHIATFVPKPAETIVKDLSNGKPLTTDMLIALRANIVARGFENAVGPIARLDTHIDSDVYCAIIAADFELGVAIYCLRALSFTQGTIAEFMSNIPKTAVKGQNVIYIMSKLPRFRDDPLFNMLHVDIVGSLAPHESEIIKWADGVK